VDCRTCDGNTKANMRVAIHWIGVADEVIDSCIVEYPKRRFSSALEVTACELA
jgi:hypothetical protein